MNSFNCDSTPLVLTVDDEPSLLDFQRELLTAFGVEVITSTNAEDAVAKALEASERLSCVITDFAMPKKNGLWLIRELEEHLPSVPVILITGYQQQPFASPNLFAVLLKPCSVAVLVSTIEEAIQKAQSPTTVTKPTLHSFA